MRRTVPSASGPLVAAVFSATMVLPRVTVPLAVVKAAAASPAELPLTVTLVSVVVPLVVGVQAAAVPSAELPLTVQLVSGRAVSSVSGRRRQAELPLTVRRRSCRGCR